MVVIIHRFSVWLQVFEVNWFFSVVCFILLVMAALSFETRDLNFIFGGLWWPSGKSIGRKVGERGREVRERESVIPIRALIRGDCATFDQCSFKQPTIKINLYNFLRFPNR